MTKEQQIEVFLDELASSASTPGGGGAAAIMGAMGAALVSMVCNLTIGKEKYADVEEELKGVLDQAESLRARLTNMIQADVEVFNRVMASYRLPKGTDEEKAARSAEIQEALKAATDVPLECAKACAEVIALSRTAAKKGNLNVISDAGVAVMAGYAALKSAALNVNINIGGIRDPEFANSRRQQLIEVLDGCGCDTDEIYKIVEGKL
ncbi:MAG: cyclodeaminase/cyclohydrolase family protein [Pseudomonadota bacterium]|nr:cyclodeaminase/cyclohydrolase family protein [Pseudomonadota bacterium]